MKKPLSIQNRLNHLVTLIIIMMAVILASVLVLVVSTNGQYARFLYNVTTASDFNRDFKDNIDQKMYYYVIESQYSEGLPIQEVHSAQALARDLLSTTTQKDSLQAITSVLDLCENLEEKIYQIQGTTNYDERQTQLENNIYVLTSLIQEYMYTYLYYEAVELNAIQMQMETQLFWETVWVTVITAAIIILALHHSIRLSRSITEPLEALYERAKQVTEGDLSIRQPIRSEAYEIRTLSEAMEDMIARLNDQMLQMQQKQETLRRTELALLQAQINPHFLYNTMDTIIWLIEAGKNQEAVDMVSNLSGFFRHSLSKGHDVISLEEEEQHVCSYLQIQHARYKDIMEYSLDIAPELRGCMIPKLTLQPLVENALYHGIKLKRAVGHIAISGRLEDGHAVLQVTDNGVGMTRERLQHLRKTMENQKRVGFGLSAVNQRLQLMFGSAYGLLVQSTEGEGTTVTIRIPFRRQEDIT